MNDNFLTLPPALMVRYVELDLDVTTRNLLQWIYPVIYLPGHVFSLSSRLFDRQRYNWGKHISKLMKPSKKLKRIRTRRM